MAFCSAVTLCFASIFSLAAAALLAIAFSTDNWQTISVNKQYNAAEVAPENVAKDLVSDYNITASNSLTAYVTICLIRNLLTLMNSFKDMKSLILLSWIFSTPIC